MLIIIWNFSSRNRLQEWPAALVVLDECQNVVELNHEDFGIAVLFEVPQVLWGIPRWHFPAQLTQTWNGFDWDCSTEAFFEASQTRVDFLDFLLTLCE